VVKKLKEKEIGLRKEDTRALLRAKPTLAISAVVRMEVEKRVLLSPEGPAITGGFGWEGFSPSLDCLKAF